MVNRIKVNREGEASLTGHQVSHSQVDNKFTEGGEITKVTKTVKGNAKQATKPPTGEKMLSAKDLAVMANIEPRVLRRCLRKHFSSRLSATKGANGLKTYHVKASDPIVKEIIAKVKSNGNGDKGKVAAKAAVQPVKGKAIKQTPAKVPTAYDEVVKGKAAKPITAKTPAKVQEPVMPAAQAAEAGLPENHDEKGEGEEPSPESSNYSGWDNFSPELDFNTNSSIVLTGTNKPEVAGSNPAPATNEIKRHSSKSCASSICVHPI